MTPFEVLYGRVCISSMGWFESGDVKPLWIESMKDNQDKVRRIQDKLLAAQSRKEVRGSQVRDMEFYTVVNVVLNVSPMKGVMIFG